MGTFCRHCTYSQIEAQAGSATLSQHFRCGKKEIYEKIAANLWLLSASKSGGLLNPTPSAVLSLKPKPF